MILFEVAKVYCVYSMNRLFASWIRVMLACVMALIVGYLPLYIAVSDKAEKACTNVKKSRITANRVANKRLHVKQNREWNIPPKLVFHNKETQVAFASVERQCRLR